MKIYKRIERKLTTYYVLKSVIIVTLLFYAVLRVVVSWVQKNGLTTLFVSCWLIVIFFVQKIYKHGSKFFLTTVCGIKNILKVYCCTKSKQNQSKSKKRLKYIHLECFLYSVIHIRLYDVMRVSSGLQV